MTVVTVISFVVFLGWEKRGQNGWHVIPLSFDIHDGESFELYPDINNPYRPNAKALYDCEAEDVQELTFVKGEILYNGKLVISCDSHVTTLIKPVFFSIVEESAEEPQWLTASKANGKRGLVPSNYVELLP